jgi:thymidine kinase
MDDHGKLDIYIGSMFSGKSTALLRKLYQLHDIGYSVLYINHSFDIRSEKSFSTHNNLIKNNVMQFDNMKVSQLENIDLNSIQKYEVIGIDEGQFFSEHILTFVKTLVDNHHKYVIVSGLDGTFNRTKMGYILDLIPIADNVVKLHAYCKICSGDKKLVPGIFTHYTGEDKVNIINIGAKDFMSVCRKCYLSNNK